MFAKVIVDIKHEEVNRAFDYLIPDEFQDFLVLGMRVMVPFGAQIRMGYVVEIAQESQRADKPILEVLDAVPTIDEEAFLMIDHLKQKTLAPDSVIFDQVVSNELSMTYKKRARLLDPNRCPEDLIVKFNKRQVWHLNQKDQIYYPRLKRLKDQGILHFETLWKQKGQKKTIKAYRRVSDDENYAIKYPWLDELFRSDELVLRKTLLDYPVSASSLKTLTKHGVLVETEQRVVRDVLPDQKPSHENHVLNEEQQSAVDTIRKTFGTNQTVLLHGVAGSGKTEVYMNLMEEILDNRQSILYLVPEIALIPQTIERLHGRFDHIMVYHSGLSQGERYDQFLKLYEDQPIIVLGTRSAAYLPISNLGMIIADDAHDDSYVQNEGLYVDTMDILSIRSTYHQAPLILGTATPSLSQMYHTKKGDNLLVELKHRATHVPMPTIHYIDMKKELKERHTSIFSRALIEGIEQRLSQQTQTMILINRKGYAPFVLCRACGAVPCCPHCDVSLTYHQDRKILKCHYCGYETPFTETCEVCHEPKIKPVGVGIEYVESQLKKQFPTARILKMDRYHTQTKGAHESLWHQFESHEADILLGTQMIAKGLDFPKVTLVAVLMADLLLKIPSYRASEITYQLLTQISGRSGRMMPGEVVIQGYDLHHYAIQSVQSGYDTYYDQAIKERKLLGYPPFKQTGQILIQGQGFLKTYQSAFLIKKKLSVLSIDVLGPSQTLVKKIKDQYRFILTLKSDRLDFKRISDVILSIQQEETRIRWLPALEIV